MTKPVKNRYFKVVAERTNTVIVVALLVGAGLYVWSEHSNDLVKSILAGIASAVLALGLVTFASEFFFKTAFTVDLLELTNLQHDVYNAGILGVVEESDMSWPEFLGSTRTVMVVALRPNRWVSSIWPHIRKAASVESLNVEIIFLGPDGEAAGQVAARLGQPVASYADEIRHVASTVEREWKVEKARDTWRSRSSTLQINLSDNAPTHSLLRVDGKTCLIAEPLVANAGSQTTMCFIFRDMAGESFPQRWLSAGLEDLQKHCGAPLYSDKSVKSAKESN